MRWAHLKTELARLERAGHLNDWTETGVDGFSFPDGFACMDMDSSSLQSELGEVRDDLKSREKELEDTEKERSAAEKRAEEAEEAADKLREELAQLRDPDSGVTVADYRERAEEAEKSRAQWEEHYRAAERRTAEIAEEVAAMRKRKGVEPGVMAHTGDVMGLLYSMTSESTTLRAQWQEDAKRELDSYKHRAETLLKRIQATVGAKAKPVAVAA